MIILSSLNISSQSVTNDVNLTKLGLFHIIIMVYFTKSFVKNFHQQLASLFLYVCGCYLFNIIQTVVASGRILKVIWLT